MARVSVSTALQAGDPGSSPAVSVRPAASVLMQQLWFLVARGRAVPSSVMMIFPKPSVFKTPNSQEPPGELWKCSLPGFTSRSSDGDLVVPGDLLFNKVFGSVKDQAMRGTQL